MNPPFSDECNHIRHAWEILKPWGRLVSVASASVKFNTRGDYNGFADWLDEIGAEVIDLPEGSFKASGTNVNTVLIVATK
jgi:hypothetical protein